MNTVIFSGVMALIALALVCVWHPHSRPARNSQAGFAHWPFIAAAAAVLLAIGVYVAIGRPDAINAASKTRASAAVSQESVRKTTSVAPVGSLLEGLEERLRREPDDAKGWLLLARSYDHLGRTGDAADAYENARALGQTDLLLESRLIGGAIGPTASR